LFASFVDTRKQAGIKLLSTVVASQAMLQNVYQLALVRPQSGENRLSLDTAMSWSAVRNLVSFSAYLG